MRTDSNVRIIIEMHVYMYVKKGKIIFAQTLQCKLENILRLSPRTHRTHKVTIPLRLHIKLQILPLWLHTYLLHWDMHKVTDPSSTSHLLPMLTHTQCYNTFLFNSTPTCTYALGHTQGHKPFPLDFTPTSTLEHTHWDIHGDRGLQILPLRLHTVTPTSFAETDKVTGPSLSTQHLPPTLGYRSFPFDLTPTLYTGIQTIKIELGVIADNVRRV